ncbi:MAG: undecaprenyl-diphosphate phosphatase [Anaerolineae bacterium]|nr:undecaprenyl-diphosphate phosphatase [Anaerolineae bacterium]
MDLLKAIFLGLLQGTTEFLPISSSGHLVLVPWWLGWEKPPLVFDVVVHLGTLVAVLVYFWRDWLTLFRASVHALRNLSQSNELAENPDTRLVLWLIVGTIPAATIGLLLEGMFTSTFSHPPLAAFFLLVTAGIMTVSERAHLVERDLNEMTARDALMIGIAQVFAIFPGISRSGSTIATGILQGLSRTTAARFSFLLGTPLIFGAGIKLLVFDVLLTDDVVISSDMVMPLIAGFITSALMGFLCIWLLLRLLQQKRLFGFAIYCVVFGLLSLGRSLPVALW